MGLFSKDKIKEAIDEVKGMQPKLEKDLKNGKKDKATQYIEETLDSLNILYTQCGENNGFKKYMPKIDAVRKTYQDMIKDYGLNIKFEPINDSTSKPNPRLK